MDNLDRARRAHDRQLGRRPRVRAAVGLTRDDRDTRHGRLAERVEQLRAVTDDAAVLLVDAGHEAGYVDEGDDGDVERVTGAHEARGLLTRIDVEHAGEDL